MKKEGLFDIQAAEANIELNDKMNGNSRIPHGNGEEASATAEANLDIQDAFYGGNDQDEVLPTYMNNDTPAIKVTGNKK